MMKTTISICCDNCEKVLSDDTVCYGIKRNSPSNDLFICESCMKLLICKAMNNLLDFLRYSPSRTQKKLSLFTTINHNPVKLGELENVINVPFFHDYTDINVFLYSYNDYKRTIIFDKHHFESIPNLMNIGIYEGYISEIILDAIDHDKLSILRNRYNAERNYSASISTSQYIEH